MTSDEAAVPQCRRLDGRKPPPCCIWNPGSETGEILPGGPKLPAERERPQSTPLDHFPPKRGIPSFTGASRWHHSTGTTNALSRDMTFNTEAASCRPAADFEVSAVEDTQGCEALCARCRRAAGCTIPDESGEPVLSCQVFDSLECVAPANSRESARPASFGSQRDPSRLEGLCGDCGNRVTCVFRLREGGTWHCEEYQ